MNKKNIKMKAISLLLLRLSTGLYMIFWGAPKLINIDDAVERTNRYYGGLISGEVVVMGMGLAQTIVGAFVVLGLFRNISYKAQAVIYFLGLALIIQYVLDPFGLYLVERGRLTWFPSTTLFFASLVLIAFKSEDTMSVDQKRGN